MLRRGRTRAKERASSTVQGSDERSSVAAIKRGQHPAKLKGDEMKKDEAQHLIDCVKELLRLIPKSKKMEALGLANELFLHLEKVKREAK